MILSFYSDDQLRAYPPLKKSYPQRLQVPVLGLAYIFSQMSKQWVVNVKGISHTGLPLDLYKGPQWIGSRVREEV